MITPSVSKQSLRFLWPRVWLRCKTTSLFFTWIMPGSQSFFALFFEVVLLSDFLGSLLFTGLSWVIVLRLRFFVMLSAGTLMKFSEKILPLYSLYESFFAFNYRVCRAVPDKCLNPRKKSASTIFPTQHQMSLTSVIVNSLSIWLVAEARGLLAA